ncbi:ice-binding family protein [Aeromicrobium sp.]|uniref:ice-binding family protein n=1 Tax=Aeromicrobium sp. TaxID=1871063 RepID=UPI0025BA185C|nr:ice-binding family protein [Aeromicrobium sp.]MCK5890208.1 DUF3494 domain-containing protein [Aeromicrobium sp.]
MFRPPRSVRRENRRDLRRPRLLIGAALVAALCWTGAPGAYAADPEIDLQSAGAFSVLAGSGVTNTGDTRLAQSIGSHETPTITTDTPFTFTAPGATNHAGDAVTQLAKADLLTAYNAAAGALPPTAIPQELVRTEPYLPGIYAVESSMLLSGAITLDGGGRSDGVFVFQVPSSLTTASNSVVLFVNGAQPCNVYWQIGSSATFGSGTVFVGNVLADTSITANTNATFQGRLLASNGAVTLDTNTITVPACQVDGDGDGDGDGEGDGDGDGDSDGEGGGGTTDPGSGTPSGPGTVTPGSGDGGAGVGGGAGSGSGTPPGASQLPATGGPAVTLLAAGALALVGGGLLLQRFRGRAA